MFILRALIWLAIVLLLIPAAEGRHGQGAGAEEARAGGPSLSAARSSPPPLPGQAGQPDFDGLR